MTNMVKTTIMLPEETFKQAKIKAVNENTTLSRLINKALQDELEPKAQVKKDIDPMQTLGKYTLGIKKNETFHRKDMYDDYLKRKMGH